MIWLRHGYEIDTKGVISSYIKEVRTRRDLGFYNLSIENQLNRKVFENMDKFYVAFPQVLNFL